MSEPILEFESVSKSFGRVPVLRDVSFFVPRGCTLGLVGENGAGKSTLLNILGGNLRADSGEILFQGIPFQPSNPREATRAGIALVHQELNLFPNLSIAENFFLQSFPVKGIPGLRSIKRSVMLRRSHELLEQVGVPISPDTLVERLSPGERQLVEIAKAIRSQPTLLLLDEPTTSLSAAEAERVLRLVEELRSDGLSIIYISHNLADVLRLSDRLVVLRDGAVVETGAREQFTADRLVTLMVGRSIHQMFPTRAAAISDQPVLQVRNLTRPGWVRSINLNLYPGEVLGLCGLMGSGRSELARILFGLERAQQGEILLRGRRIDQLPTRERIRQGLAFVTEDRRQEGLALEASIADNMTLVHLPSLSRSRLGLLDSNALAEAVQTMGKAVRLAGAAGDWQPAKVLSGGNQQKVVLAKWLMAEPQVLMLDEPTRGIDVGAKVEIYALINRLAEQGASILLISSEIEELMGMADRILVMSQGRLRDEVRRAEFDRERLLRSALHRRADSGSSESA